MAFTGLEDRFLANVNQLYTYRSPRDKGDGSLGAQPFILSNPLSYRNVGGDERFLPVQSTINDVSRIGGFLKTPQGRFFLIEQGVMQAGTAFTETRVLNPLFIIGNAVPFLHLTRPLAVASDFTPSGDITQMSPASSDPNIGSAGRMQQNTAADAVSRAMNTGGGSSGLLGLLNPAQLLQNISSVFSLVTGGPEGINERPEFNVGDNTMYSVALWEGFQKQPWALSPLSSAAQNLRKGNILGAAINIAQTVSNVVTGFPASLLPPELNATPSSERGNSSEWLDGKRYFITDADSNADRYLKNSVIFGATPDGSSTPITNMSFLYRTAYAIPDAPASVVPDSAPISPMPSISNFSTQSGFDSFINTQVSAVKSFATDTLKSIRLPISVPGLRGFNNPLSGVIPSPLSTNTANSDNPAEDDMLFPGLAMRQRYLNDERMSDIRNSLQSQKTKGLAYFTTPSQNFNPAEIMTKRGFDEGDGLIGQENNRDSRVRSTDQENLNDEMNWIDIHQGDDSDTVIPASYINTLKKVYGSDLINVFFYDYVNKRTIPFRAFVTNIQETVQPEYNDTKYIGRLERNVVYVGVARNLSFTLKIYAMSQVEMTGIWKKINYMTGLCYPAQYNSGFMVPPLVKLTIGDFYRDQPGYIRTLVNAIEDDTSWEVTEGQQVPMGITMNISFAVLEKKLMRSESTFYPFGVPRDPTTETTNTNHIPDTTINTTPAIPNPTALNNVNIPTFP